MKTIFVTTALFLTLTFSLSAAPIAYDEISLLVRMHETDSFIGQQLAQRQLLRALTPEQEAELKAQGASDVLIQALRNPSARLSDAESIAFDTKREQQKQAMLATAAAKAWREQQEKLIQAAKAAQAAAIAATTTLPIELEPDAQPIQTLSNRVSVPARPRAIRVPIFTSRQNTPDFTSNSSLSFDSTINYAPKLVPSVSTSQYDPNSLANPYGAGSPYKADGLMNPYSQYGSRYSNKSWTNPYATDAPKLYDSSGNYKGRLSTNPYAPDSTSNPYGRYGSKYSPDSINNPFGAGSPYSSQPTYVVPQR